jgi:hypothetical protein
MKYITKNIDVILAVCLGLFWLIFIYVSGLGLSPDSTHYMVNALNMHYAFDFSSFSLSVIPLWPPFYAFLLNLFMFFNVFPAEAAALLSGCSMLILLVIFTLILKKFSQNLLLNTLFVLTLFTLTGFLDSYLFVMSESPFALFLILHIYFLLKHNETQLVKYYVLAAIFVSLATLTRYMGYPLILTFFIYTIYFLVKSGKQKNQYFLWNQYLLLNSLTYLPIILYLVRNYMISRTFHGHREPAELSIFQNLHRVVEVFTSDFSIFLLILLIISLIFYVFLIKNRNQLIINHSLLALSYIFAFIVIYTIMIVYTTSQVIVNPISTRYFSPIYFTFFLFIFISFNSILRFNSINHINRKYSVFWQIALYFSILITLLINIQNYIQLINKVSNKQDTTAYYSDIGFKFSTTSKNLNEYFDKIFTHQDKLYVSFLSHNEYVVEGSFFFRYFLTDQKFRHFSFKEVKNYWWTNFTISFSKDDRNKTLHYVKVASYIKGGKSFVKEIRQTLSEEKIDLLKLIVDKRWQNKKLSRFSTKRVQITLEKKIEPYLIYSVSRLHKVHNLPSISTF